MGIFSHKCPDLDQFFFRLQNIDLIDNDDNFLAPIADALEKNSLALSKRPVGGSDEEDQIGARHKLGGDCFVLPNDGIGAWRVYDADFPQ